MIQSCLIFVERKQRTNSTPAAVTMFGTNIYIVQPDENQKMPAERCVSEEHCAARCVKCAPPPTLVTSLHTCCNRPDILPKVGEIFNT